MFPKNANEFHEASPADDGGCPGDARRPAPGAAGAARSAASAGAAGLLCRLVFAIDRRLQLHHGVEEFTRHPQAIFRLQLCALEQDVAFDDGTGAERGDRIVNLHLWNEQLPILRGDSLRWARQMNHCLDVSLRELAKHLAAHDDSDEIVAIRAEMGFGTAAQVRQLVRISSRYGFEPVADLRVMTGRRRLRRFGENVLISLMVLARNGVALRTDTLARSRVQVFLSRRTLMRRYAGCGTRAA